MVLHTATEAILVLLKKLGAHGQKVYVPSIICSSVEYLLEWYGVEVAYYDPFGDSGYDELAYATIIIWVPYFGYSRSPGNKLLQKLPMSCKVIIDSAHSPMVSKSLRESFGDREVYIVSSSRKIDGLEDSVSIYSGSTEVQLKVSNAQLSRVYAFIMERSKSFGLVTLFILFVSKVGLVARPPTGPCYQMREPKKQILVKRVNEKNSPLSEERERRFKSMSSLWISKALVPMWDADPDDVLWCIPIGFGSFRSLLLKSIIISLKGTSSFIWPHYAKKNQTGSFFLCARL